MIWSEKRFCIREFGNRKFLKEDDELGLAI